MKHYKIFIKTQDFVAGEGYQKLSIHMLPHLFSQSLGPTDISHRISRAQSWHGTLSSRSSALTTVHIASLPLIYKKLVTMEILFYWPLQTRDLQWTAMYHPSSTSLIKTLPFLFHPRFFLFCCANNSRAPFEIELVCVLLLFARPIFFLSLPLPPPPPEVASLKGSNIVLLPFQGSSLI